MIGWLQRLLSPSSVAASIPPAPADMLGAATLPVISVGDNRGRAVPEAAIAMIAKWEGFRAKAYRCPADILTIGYGATRYSPGRTVKEGDTITEPAARALLREQAANFAREVDALVKVPITAGQRGALISFAYNFGAGKLRDSTLLRLLNGGRQNAAAEQFALWIKGGDPLRIMPGLVARRVDERKMFVGQHRLPAPPAPPLPKS